MWKVCGGQSLQLTAHQNQIAKQNEVTVYNNDGGLEWAPPHSWNWTLYGPVEQLNDNLWKIKVMYDKKTVGGAVDRTIMLTKKQDHSWTVK